MTLLAWFLVLACKMSRKFWNTSKIKIVACPDSKVLFVDHFHLFGNFVELKWSWKNNRKQVNAVSLQTKIDNWMSTFLFISIVKCNVDGWCCAGSSHCLHQVWRMNSISIQTQRCKIRISTFSFLRNGRFSNVHVLNRLLVILSDRHIPSVGKCFYIEGKGVVAHLNH